MFVKLVVKDGLSQIYKELYVGISHIIFVYATDDNTFGVRVQVNNITEDYEITKETYDKFTKIAKTLLG